MAECGGSFVRKGAPVSDPVRETGRELLNAKQAAFYLGVSKTYFEATIRPLLSFSDLRAPGSKKPMPRWSRTDLDAFVAKRRVERKSA